ESATISLLFASTAAEAGPREATAKAAVPAPNLRTVRRSRSQSVETASGFFMVSPEAADNRQEFSRSGWQVAKKSDPRLFAEGSRSDASSRRTPCRSRLRTTRGADAKLFSSANRNTALSPSKAAIAAANFHCVQGIGGLFVGRPASDELLPGNFLQESAQF